MHSRDNVTRSSYKKEEKRREQKKKKKRIRNIFQLVSSNHNSALIIACTRLLSTQERPDRVEVKTAHAIKSEARDHAITSRTVTPG
ncbi:unnamed protein product, partial [Brenthis ino]